MVCWHDKKKIYWFCWPLKCLQKCLTETLQTWIKTDPNIQLLLLATSRRIEVRKCQSVRLSFTFPHGHVWINVSKDTERWGQTSFNRWKPVALWFQNIDPIIICRCTKALNWRCWRRYFLEVTLACGGSLRIPIVCRSTWKEASVWMWGFGMTPPWLPLLSGCLDRQLSLCVSVNSLVQQRQTVCLCQLRRAAVTLHIYVFQ